MFFVLGLYTSIIPFALPNQTFPVLSIVIAVNAPPFNPSALLKTLKESVFAL